MPKNERENPMRFPVTLQDGTETDSIAAMAALRSLARLLENDAVSFQALRKAALESTAVPPGRPRRALRALGHVDSTGVPRPVPAAVAVAAYRETVEGPVLGSPFRADTDEDRTRLDRLERWIHDREDELPLRLMSEILAGRDSPDGPAR